MMRGSLFYPNFCGFELQLLQIIRSEATFANAEQVPD
jgi:hypothetical protein